MHWKKQHAHTQTPNSDENMKFKLYEVTGNIFDVAHCSFAHCISRDMYVGSGMSLQFHRHYVNWIRDVQAQGAGVGEVAILERADGHFVYNLVIKEKHYHYPALLALTLSLNATKDHMLRNGVRRLAIPRLACGLDGLDWAEVKKAICSIFKDTIDIEITVYSLERRKGGCRHWREKLWPLPEEPETDYMRTQSQRHRELY